MVNSETQAQKEKWEGELKKQIKKLQRQRDSIRTWLSSTDTTIAVGIVCVGDVQQYADRMNTAKNKIESLMYSFRECEKETKTKAFSKEGLRQPHKKNQEDV